MGHSQRKCSPVSLPIVHLSQRGSSRTLIRFRWAYKVVCPVSMPTVVLTSFLLIWRRSRVMSSDGSLRKFPACRPFVLCAQVSRIFPDSHNLYEDSGHDESIRAICSGLSLLPLAPCFASSSALSFSQRFEWAGVHSRFTSLPSAISFRVLIHSRTSFDLITGPSRAFSAAWLSEHMYSGEFALFILAIVRQQIRASPTVVLMTTAPLICSVMLL